MSMTHAPDDRPTSRPAAGSVRASDAEREAVVAALHAALGEGRLDLAETESRVIAAYAARVRADLSPLLTDLPGGTARIAAPLAGPSAPAWSVIWTDAVWRARTVLLGPDEPRPGAAQCRTAAVLSALVVLWLLVCLLLGASLP
jgi:hypothetical protein